MDSPAPQFNLGAFELQSLLGRGAMGEVWRARHRYQDVPVAIKVLNEALARDDWALEAFTNEVRAAAGLDHPGIMMLLDQGMVSAAEAEASGGRVQGGSPYLVMELVEGRPLHHFAGRLDWPTIHHVMVQLLESLAHSHARAVIHRDVKPGNVLVEIDPRKGRTDPERMRVTLTDFGLARALERHSAVDQHIAGTPAYMAPEQLRGRWRDQGPWTDLYSLGCLGWALVTGEPPFGRKRSIQDFCHDHLHLPPPPLDSAAPVPRDLEAWLHRLLQKRPEERFTRAADALSALNQLRGSMVESAAKAIRLQLSAETTRPRMTDAPLHAEDAAILDDCSTQEDMLSEISTRILVGDLGSTSGQPPALPSRTLPPMEVLTTPIPETWEREPRILARKARGVGLSLYGLSPVPMVDRFEERDELWSTLREVDATASTQVVLLEGPSGCGKSRLARWLCEEANASAGVTVLHAHHSALPEPTNGLAPMLARALRCRELDRRELVERLAQVLPRIGLAELNEVHALAELISPASESDHKRGSRVIRFHNSRERYHLVRRVLQRVGLGANRNSPPRSVIVLLDDLQWGTDALAFADYLVSHPELSPAPILVVGTVQIGALGERPEEAELLARLRDRPQTRCISVQPLSRGHHRTLIQRLLGKEGQLIEKVAKRTAGNPLFAVQLVGDWVERGVLLTGPAGLSLKPGAEIELPDNLHAIWDSRIDRFLDRHESKAGRALEVAATLGDKVDRREWRAAAERLGVRPSPSLVAGLVRSRLVMADPEGKGWSFSHPMLRECLERRARASRRASQVHLACARMLQERSQRLPGSAERIGTHLLRGGEALEALSYFLHAAEERFNQGAFHQVAALLGDWEQAMVKEGMPASEPMWGRGWLLRGRVDRALGRLEEANLVISRAMKVSEEQGWPDVVAACLCEGGVVLHRLGETTRGWKRLRKAEGMARTLGNDELMAQVLNAQGVLLAGQGRLDKASLAFESFRELSARTGDKAGEAESYFQLGQVDKQAGRLPMAQVRLGQSLELFESLGARWGMAKAVNELGEIARLENRLGEAEICYRQALEKMDELGLIEATVPRLNLALVMMQQEKYIGAQPLVEHAHETFERSGSRARMGLTHLMLLICSVAQGHWVDWEYHLAEARGLLADTGFVDVDLALCATAVGDMALDEGYVDRACAAWDLALDQWLSLNRPEKSALVRERILHRRKPGKTDA